eukprot:3731573-Lingulodinium_polyedra.AAC.1
MAFVEALGIPKNFIINIFAAMGAKDRGEGPFAYPLTTGGHCKLFNELAARAYQEFEERERALHGKSAEAQVEA